MISRIENNLIFKKYITARLVEGVSDRLLTIVDSGLDVFMNQYADDVIAVVFNTGTKGKSPSESVISQAALDAIESTLDDIGSEDEFDDDSDTMTQFNFFEEDDWVRVDRSNIQQIMSSSIPAILTDQNGSFTEKIN